MAEQPKHHEGDEDGVYFQRPPSPGRDQIKNPKPTGLGALDDMTPVPPPNPDPWSAWTKEEVEQWRSKQHWQD